MKFLSILYKAALCWIDKGVVYYAAAFSYYAPLALIPLLLFSVSAVGYIYGDVFTSKVFFSWGSVLGNDLLSVIQIAVSNLDIETQASKVPILVGVFFLGLYVVAFNVIGEGFQKLWDTETSGIRSFVIKSIRSIGFLFVLQIYFIFLIGLEFFIAPGVFETYNFASYLLLFCSTTVLFATLYHLLVSKSPSWKASWIGASVSSLLFVVIKNLIDLYISTTPALLFYGTAGIILVLLIWVYILAALIFYGAAVAGQYDKMKLNEVTSK